MQPTDAGQLDSGRIAYLHYNYTSAVKVCLFSFATQLSGQLALAYDVVHQSYALLSYAVLH